MAEGTGLISQFWEHVIGKGELGLIDELTTEDVVDHEEGLPGQPSGREGVKFFVNAMRGAFPDIRATTVEPTMADGNLEAARAVVTGTHKGELMGVAPTDKAVEFESIDINPRRGREGCRALGTHRRDGPDAAARCHPRIDHELDHRGQKPR